MAGSLIHTRGPRRPIRGPHRGQWRRVHIEVNGNVLGSTSRQQPRGPRRGKWPGSHGIGQGVIDQGGPPVVRVGGGPGGGLGSEGAVRGGLSVWVHGPQA